MKFETKSYVCFIKKQLIKTKAAVEVQLHPFSTSVLGRSKWSPSHPSRFNLEKNISHAHLAPKSDYYFHRVCLSVRPHEITRLPLEGSSWNVIIFVFFENLSRKFKFHLNMRRIRGNLGEDLCVYKQLLSYSPGFGAEDDGTLCWNWSLHISTSLSRMFM